MTPTATPTATPYAGIDATTGRRLDDIAHIRQSVRDILVTPVGTRVMRRSYGSLLPDLIDQPLHGATRLRLYAATYMALLQWEPRLRLTRVSLLESQLAAGAVVIELEAQRIAPEQAARPISLQIALRGTPAPQGRTS